MISQIFIAILGASYTAPHGFLVSITTGLRKTGGNYVKSCDHKKR